MSDDGPASVLLHAHDIRISADHVYFSFLSGNWSYDCVSCKAKCCRGFGYAVRPGRELDAQLKKSSAIRLFISSRPANECQQALTVGNLSPGCFMLLQDGRCGVHVTEGYDSKPETCRLFPFNRFTTIDGFLIVAPHPGLCPIDVADTPMASSDHGTLLSELQRSGISTEVSTAGCLHENTEAVIALEKAIAARADAFRGRPYEEFVREQISLTRQLVRSGQPEVDNQDTAKEFDRWLTNALGTSPSVDSAANPEIRRLMYAITPILRAQYVFPVGSKLKAAAPVPLERIPFLLLVLYKILVLAQQAGTSAITYQTTADVLARFPSLLVVGSYIDSALRWSPRVRVNLQRLSDESPEEYSAYLQVVKSLLPSQPAEPLGQLLGRVTSSVQWGRLERLERICKRLEGRLDVRLGGSVESTKPAESMRRWLLARTPLEPLVAFTEYRRRNASPSQAPSRHSGDR